MEIVNANVRKWGDSFGIVLSNEIVRRNDLREGLEIEIMIRPKHKTRGRDIFGLLKGKMGDVEELMKESDRELWGIEK